MKRLTMYFAFLYLMVFVACKGDNENSSLEEEESENNCTQNIYQEKDGFVNVEFESIISKNGWQSTNVIAGSSGDRYLVWTGNDYFNAPGNAKLIYPIKISTTGTYQFIWRSKIAQGTSNTDFNDSWLRFPTAADFYAEKDDGSIVYPKGSGKTPLPEGAGADGWFKVYMNNANVWLWRSATSDNDPHNIFVRFDSPGVYNMEVSARSSFHALDRFILFKTEVSDPTELSNPLSVFDCE
ncbi:hypothetical protein [Spongiivirga citrea]|uniref:Uncharacterized protein n=1 Tax=Spongiivirga citrea TaxID=1481457 RepID=A0A6M0CPM9_9FLAO|nr:hypothetical protein [Spongiivirga citrea]NER17819.1 hypothetical protein [Spongiivirga citrea]